MEGVVGVVVMEGVVGMATAAGWADSGQSSKAMSEVTG
jgi:hypothetical protein